MSEQAQIEIPPAPSIPGFTPEMQEQWRKSYVAAFEEFARRMPRVGNLQRIDLVDQCKWALREANRMLTVPILGSYADAMELPAWQCLMRKERDGELLIVTTDGRKYRFAIPQK